MDYGLLDPRIAGILSAGFAGLQASGPSRMPVSLGQIMGQAGAAGLGAYQSAGREARQTAQTNALLELEKQKGTMLQAQIAAAERAARREEALLQARAGIFGDPGVTPEQALSGGGGPTNENAALIRPANPGALNPAGAANYIRLGGDPKVVETIQNLGPRGKIGTIDLKEYTHDSIGQYMVTGDPSVLRPRTKVELAPGGQAFDPYATAPGTTFSDPNKPFSMGANGPVANLPFQNYEIGKAAAGSTRVQNILPSQEKEEGKQVGKFFGEQYGTIQQAGFNAGSKINRMERLTQLLDGVQTGKLTPLGTEVAAYAESVGLKIDPKLANKQAASALTNEMALELRNPAGGAGMPGAMSDPDRQFLVSMVPGLGTTPEGRRMMLDTSRKLAKRDQEVAQMARAYRTRKGQLDEGFYDELKKHADANPLFPATSASQIEALVKKYAR
jgi:hypothetical protein